ncbi:B3 domain-containing protein Os01g0723500-like [Sesamum indicum]|uniref:B3 domain-containing protein Os01g0723500-like n=1 Tax=Sesamum indicum TaxID=4182 RepID=A0A6I9T1A3_SESIN|nr:B3 domain-containing protein Os01g0723500-like [Sesamum indicum]
MEGNPRCFFKIMMPGFQGKLNLPPAFCKKVREERSDWAIVTSRKGMWKMNVCRNPEGLISFVNGWPDFVSDHGLSVGDFVVFEHTGDLHFNAVVFDVSACNKEFVVEFKKEDPGRQVHSKYHSRNTKRKPDKESVISKKPYFVLTLKSSHQKSGQVTIPASFSRSNNLNGFSSIILTDPNRREWPIKLSFQRTGQFRARMATGWVSFYASNKLQEGDVCVFEVNRSSQCNKSIMMDVKIFRDPLVHDIDSLDC